MMQEFGTLEAALAAAVGEDAALKAELRSAFLGGAAAHLETLDAAGDEAAWRTACWRLHGLAASFGAVTLMGLAADAAETRGPSPVMLKRIKAEFAILSA